MGVHDHPSDTHDFKMIVADFDLSNYETGGGDEPARVVLQPHVSILRSEVEGVASGIERVGLVALELASLLYCQRIEFNELHAFMQAKRARRGGSIRSVSVAADVFGREGLLRTATDLHGARRLPARLERPIHVGVSVTGR